MVNGHRGPPSEEPVEALHAAGRLRAALGRTIPVTGVIAIMGPPRASRSREQPRHGEVVVTTRWAVHLLLGKRPERLTAGEVAEIYAAARPSTTWLPSR